MTEQTKQTTGNHLTEVSQDTFGSYMSNWLRRVRAGDLGSLPIIIGLLAIFAYFGSQNAVFFNERNFVNLLLQMAVYTTMGIGVVFILLILIFGILA